MRRVQFYLDDELDRALTAEADRRGISRSAIVREAVKAKVVHNRWNKRNREYDPNEPDPMDELVGSWSISTPSTTSTRSSTGARGEQRRRRQGREPQAYTPPMRRIQFYADDELDRALTAEADRRGISRSAIVREAVQAKVGLNHWNKRRASTTRTHPTRRSS